LLDDLCYHKTIHINIMLIAFHVHADVRAKTSKCTFGDADSHLGATNYKDIVLKHVLPYLQVVASLTVVTL